jgi:hypothetical protein
MSETDEAAARTGYHSAKMLALRQIESEPVRPVLMRREARQAREDLIRAIGFIEGAARSEADLDRSRLWREGLGRLAGVLEDAIDGSVEVTDE